MKPYLIIIILAIFNISFSQEKNFSEEEVSVTEWIDGTLLSPHNTERPNLAIIIAGSGPTNRDGNQNFLKNNSLKKLAEGLSTKGIASFRYDKRIVKQIRQGNLDKDLVFDDFVNDAVNIVDYFKKKDSFDKIYIIGHSQGSLVGMLAAKDKADGFISLAGAGQNIGDVIIAQVSNTAPQFEEDTKKVIKKLKKGETTTDYPQALASLFNADLQPFMISWMKYNPKLIISELQIPVLILNGTKDLQVSVDEAKILKNASTEATLKIIEDMNHVLFEIEGGDLENSKSYNESFRPIASELLDNIISFIKG